MQIYLLVTIAGMNRVIFASMRKWTGILVVLLALVFSGTSAVAVNAGPGMRARPDAAVRNGNQLPHRELQQLQATVQVTPVVQKTGNSPGALSLLPQVQPVRPVCPVIFGYTVPLEKDYLFFIYPSHHFW